MTDEDKPKNWFVRVMSFGFLILLGALIGASFIFSQPPFVISVGIITVICIMAVLVLAESFNTLSVGKILTLSRLVKDAEREKSELRRDNADLRTSLINLATNVHQSQITTNISGADLPLLRKALGVVPAQKTEEEEEEEKEVARPTKTQTPTTIDERDFEFRQHLYRETEDLLIEKFVAKYALSKLDLQREVQFGVGIESLDPIMEKRSIYDGYIKTPQKEYFIEVRPQGRFVSPMWADRLYVMLAKLFFYRQAKKADAELVLLIPDLPEEPNEYRDKSRTTRFLEWFQPAISNGLLRVETFPVSRDEYQELKNKARNAR